MPYSVTQTYHAIVIATSSCRRFRSINSFPCLDDITQPEPASQILHPLFQLTVSILLVRAAAPQARSSLSPTSVIRKSSHISASISQLHFSSRLVVFMCARFRGYVNLFLYTLVLAYGSKFLSLCNVTCRNQVRRLIALNLIILFLINYYSFLVSEGRQQNSSSLYCEESSAYCHSMGNEY